MPVYPYKCNVCGEYIEIIQHMSDEHKLFHCDTKAQRIYTVPNVNKDLMYNFTASYLGDKPIDIHSRRQYKELLKKNGLVNATPLECLQEKKYAPRRLEQNAEVKTKKLVKECMTKIKDKGAMGWCVGKENLKGSDKFGEVRSG